MLCLSIVKPGDIEILHLDIFIRHLYEKFQLSATSRWTVMGIYEAQERSDRHETNTQCPLP